jgi:imidazole glycerol-phosphate synthase subunit HisF
MLARRVIVCLDVQDGRVVKGVQFADLRDIGDPAELAARYEASGADEITFLDIGASPGDRGTVLEVLRRTAEALFIPLTLGGGVRTVEDVALALRSGADKVAINTAAVSRPVLLTEAMERFGAQCVVASIDARMDGTSWKVWTHGARVETERDAVEWARECVDRGAGEILLTSIDRDGSRNGYDVELTRAVSDAVSVPVIASGGAGRPAHCCEAVVAGHADAVLVAGIVHDGEYTVASIKHALSDSGIHIR